METPRSIGVSTAWNATRHQSGKALVEELLSLGFSDIELNVHITDEMIREISDLIRDMQFRICSLHNYCPLPPGVNTKFAHMNVLPLSCPSESGRRAAVSHTINTLDWAARLGAKFVILHAGYVPIKAHQQYAIDLLNAKKNIEARDIVVADLMERSSHRLPYLDSLTLSLQELALQAEELGLKLGLETRTCYREIPTLDEFLLLFKNVSSNALGYWHDTGHAHIIESLGIAKQEDFLHKYEDRLIGMHLNDASDGVCHKPIGSGKVDFAKVLSYVRQDTELVLEIQGDSANELKKSKLLIEKVLKTEMSSRDKSET